MAIRNLLDFERKFALVILAPVIRADASMLLVIGQQLYLQHPACSSKESYSPWNYIRYFVIVPPFWWVEQMRDEKLVAFGQNIKKIRKSKGLSQEELAALAGIDRSYMGHIERGEKNITLTKIYQISEALGVEAANLFPSDPC